MSIETIKTLRETVGKMAFANTELQAYKEFSKVKLNTWRMGFATMASNILRQHGESITDTTFYKGADGIYHRIEPLNGVRTREVDLTSPINNLTQTIYVSGPKPPEDKPEKVVDTVLLCKSIKNGKETISIFYTMSPDSIKLRERELKTHEEFKKLLEYLTLIHESLSPIQKS